MIKSYAGLGIKSNRSIHRSLFPRLISIRTHQYPITSYLQQHNVNKQPNVYVYWANIHQVLVSIESTNTPRIHENHPNPRSLFPRHRPGSFHRFHWQQLMQVELRSKELLPLGLERFLFGSDLRNKPGKWMEMMCSIGAKNA